MNINNLKQSRWTEKTLSNLQSNITQLANRVKTLGESEHLHQQEENLVMDLKTYLICLNDELA